MIERLNYNSKPDKPFAYNPFLDREAYLTASVVEKASLNPYTRKQLETHIGERVNVLLSTVRYDIRGNQLYPQGKDEPAVEMFERGVGREGATTVDVSREKAELYGFKIVNQDLADSKTKIGKKRLSISSPSGNYQHNFYDIFTLCEDKNGRYVETRRYSSGLNIEQTIQALKEVALIGDDYEANPEYSLSHPIEIDASSTVFPDAESIHKYLHKNHEYISQEDFAQIIKICTPLITSYINTISQTPFDLQSQLLNYNALLYQADLAFDAIKTNDHRVLRGLVLKSQSSYPTRQEIQVLGSQPVRQAMIGCGFSGGFNAKSGLETMKSPFSVADKDPNKTTQEQTTLCCKCPFCEKEVEAQIGGGRIKCPKCKKSAPYSKAA